MQAPQITFSTTGWIGNPYGSICSFNADCSMFSCIAVDHWQIRTISGALYLDIETLPAQAGDLKWSRTDPRYFYYISGNRLMTSDVDWKAQTAVHEFTEYISIYGGGESDISPDNDHFVLAGTKTDGAVEVFVYSLKDGKGPVYPQTQPFDGLKIDGKHRIILSRSDGIFVIDSAAKSILKICDTNGHAALTLDADGSDVLIWTSNQDNGIYKVPIDGRLRTLLMTPPWQVAVDISCPDRGDPIVSTYSLDPGYPGRVLQVALDGSGSTGLCETGSVQIKMSDGSWAYNCQPKASVSRDGRYIIGCSNFGKTADPNYCDCFLFELNSAHVNAVTPEQNSTETIVKDKYGEEWILLGTVPYDESTDVISTSADSKTLATYRRK